jgi:hypothetical protein
MKSIHSRNGTLILLNDIASFREDATGQFIAAQLWRRRLPIRLPSMSCREWP